MFPSLPPWGRRAFGSWPFTLGLPIVAVILVVLAGRSTAGAVGAALVGVLVIAVFGLVLWLVFRSDASAHRLGHLGDRALNWVLHFRHNPASDREERAAHTHRSTRLGGTGASWPHSTSAGQPVGLG